MPIPEPRDAWPFLVALPSVAYLVGARDHDVGGYRESWSVSPDKLNHCLGQGLITAGLIELRVNRWAAATASALGAIAFELGQRHGKRGTKGFFSLQDASYGTLCSGGVSLFSWTF